MLRRSASGVSGASGRRSFATGTDSPVSAASAICSAAPCEQPRVGGDGVARLEQQDVSRHDLARLDERSLSVAHHARLVGRELAQRLERALGAPLLERADDGVQERRRRR